LHCGLNTENQIAEEEDVIWDWTKLFTEVVSTLTKENDNNVEDIFASGGTSATNESDAFKTKSDLTSTTTTTSTKRQRDTLLF
jgi:hypothetical protein